MTSQEDPSPSERMRVAGALLRDARKRAGISREHLGQRVHDHGYRMALDADTVGRWERGERPISKLATPHLEDILRIEIPR